MTNMAENMNSNNMKRLWSDATESLHRVRGISHSTLTWQSTASSNTLKNTLDTLSSRLEALSKPAEAEAVQQTLEKAIESASFGGLGLKDSEKTLQEADHEEILFVLEACLESLNSAERVPRPLSPTETRSHNTRPMTLAEKIFAQHTVGGCSEAGLKAGDVIRTSIDWILASELSWNSMARTYEKLGSPGIWRNDRFWLAGDHVVHPKIRNEPKIKALVNTSEKAKKDFKMTEYQGMNYTIMHTEFVRERAEPGMLVIGSDSHTCSAGAVGCLSIGLGTADVMLTLSLGETWFKIPESIRIEFVGQPAPGMSGKDVILYILKQLKRNTVAAERIVEFSGPGLKFLSCDARFAISNMCTEFGAISGIFEPDGITQSYISKRKRKANKSNSSYFKADPDAEYAGIYTIDLAKVEPSVAVYPKPDDVIPVSEMAGTKLDGVFIGACTTTEEELVLAALILKAGLSKGLKPSGGKRHYVPGSLPIVEKLKDLGLLEIYEAAGFTRGPPGCSFCVGLSAEKASEGETWLSSQNRNFENRMGKGAFGHVTSAVVCAASSFSMTITDPAPFLQDLDIKFFNRYRGSQSDLPLPSYVEPALLQHHGLDSSVLEPPPDSNLTRTATTHTPTKITSKMTLVGDFIDTDALAPGHTLTTCTTDAEFGAHVLEHTHPSFRHNVSALNRRVVIAGHAFGVGSSREVAVSALKGIGVQCVIARSFAFIYGRNQPSLGLLGFTIQDEEFWTATKEGRRVEVDVERKVVVVLDDDGEAGESELENKNGTDGKKESMRWEFPFRLSDIEYNLIYNGGITESYNKYGKQIWTALTGAAGATAVTAQQSQSPVRKNENEIIEASKAVKQPGKSMLDW